jgi:MerR family transcriptional regulator, mercuric resistance operon regulatory protein
MFTIGTLSKNTDCPIETIRYYERIGLLENPHRTEGGHRLYNEKHQKRLEFILKTRQLGFSLEHTRSFLEMSQNTEQTCNQALALVQENMQGIEQKLIELQEIHQRLSQLAVNCKTCCPNGKAAECTIIDAFSSREKSPC